MPTINTIKLSFLRGGSILRCGLFPRDSASEDAYSSIDRHMSWLALFIVMALTLITTTGCGNNSSSSQTVATPTPTLMPTPSPTDTIIPQPTAADTPIPTLSPTDTITPEPTEVDTPIPTLSPADAPTRRPSCSWQWANKDLPDQTEMAHKALLEAGIPVTDVNVSAYGENYVCDGQVQQFTKMDTSLSASLVFDTEATLAELGDTTATVLTVLIEAQLLYRLHEVVLLMESKHENISVRFKPGSTEFQEAFKQELTGVELLEALNYTSTQ